MLSDDFELVSKHFVMMVSSGHVQCGPKGKNNGYTFVIV
jgi:hypothetical protein